MMKNLQIIFFIGLLPFVLTGQNKENLTFEFSSNLNSFNMERLNAFLLDTNFNGYSNSYIPQYNTPPTETIKRGYSFKASINYQPLNFISFGVYGSYQSGKIERFPTFSTALWGDTTSYNGTFTLKTSAFGFGANTIIFINKLLRFENKNSFLKHVIIGIELSSGIGFSRLEDLTVYEVLGESRLYNHKAQNFQGEVSLKIGTLLTKKTLISSMGLRIGYQYFKTSTVKNLYGEGLFGTSSNPFEVAEQTVNLDFSGFFAGIFINLGK